MYLGTLDTKLVSNAGARLSVVIPTFNRARTLDRVLKSIERQTVLPDEVIVVDDGSTDNTLEVLANWKALDSIPLMIVNQANRGASAARNTGMRAATGELVAFIDSDDEYAPTAIETLKKIFHQSPGAIVAFGDAAVLENGHPKTASFIQRRLTTVGVHYDDQLRLVDPAGLLLYGAFLGAFACRKEALLAVGGYDESLPRVNDRDLYLRLAMSVAGDWVFTWDRLETKHYTEGSLSSRNNARRHYEMQLTVLGKFADAPRFRTGEGKRLFAGAVKKSARAALDLAGRESHAQVIRTTLHIPPFARTCDTYFAAAVAFGLGIARSLRDKWTYLRPQAVARDK